MTSVPGTSIFARQEKPVYEALKECQKKRTSRASDALVVPLLFTSFANGSVMQGYHTQLDNVCIARLRLYSRRTRISTNTRTIFTFCILKLQTSGIYIIKHENENLKLIMYIVANVLASFSGERSVCKVLVRKGHLCFTGFLVVHEDGDKGLETSTDKNFRATKSKTMPYRREG